ncbi:MAG: hypothetical protein HY247_08370 [archaeon]|nr:MAG: hypothetical protein HY247_08370 [archaeon]
MKVHWMRYLVGDAGHLQRTYLAVLTASKYRALSIRPLCELFIEKYGGLTVEGPRKRGLLDSEWRSAEPHFSFARELDFLEGRRLERWDVTFGAGRTFLTLWEAKQRQTELLLHQFLTHDRTFSLPFLSRLVDADYDFGRGRFKGLEGLAREVWEEIWKAHRYELVALEPPLPDSVKVTERTLLHHASARIRFLNRMDGLALNIDVLRRLTEGFQGTEDSDRMPADSFARIKAATSGLAPAEATANELHAALMDAYQTLQKAGYMSGYGAYLLVNQKLPANRYVAWETLVNHARVGEGFVWKSSFRSDDFLLGISPQKKVAM